MILIMLENIIVGTFSNVTAQIFYFSQLGSNVPTLLILFNPALSHLVLRSMEIFLCEEVK